MNLEPKYIGWNSKVQTNCTFFISDLNEYSDSKQVVCYDNESRDTIRKCTKKVTFGFKKFKKTKTFMQKNPYILKPRIKPLIVEGNLSYNENVRCNNILRFKKEIREEFEGLQSKEQLIRTGWSITGMKMNCKVGLVRSLKIKLDYHSCCFCSRERIMKRNGNVFTILQSRKVVLLQAVFVR